MTRFERSILTALVSHNIWQRLDGLQREPNCTYWFFRFRLWLLCLEGLIEKQHYPQGHGLPWFRITTAGRKLVSRHPKTAARCRLISASSPRHSPAR